MNIQTIAEYVGWGFLAIFLIIIFGIAFLLLRDRQPVDKDLKEEKKNAKKLLKSINPKDKAAKARAKKDLDVDPAPGFLAGGDKAKPAGFAPAAADPSEVLAGLSALNGARTTNPFRDRTPDEETFRAPVQKPLIDESAPRPAFAPNPVDSVPAAPVTPAVAPQPVAPTPAPPAPVARPQIPTAPQPDGMPQRPAGGPPVISGEIPSKFQFNRPKE